MKKIMAVILSTFTLQAVSALSACASATSSYADNVGEIDLTTLSVSGLGITVSGNRVEITQGGDFTVTGENTDCMIYVNTSDKVKLRLSGVNIKSSQGPAIFFDNVDKGLITITENTENYVEDSSDYTDIDAKSAIFSNDDLEIKGNGTLTVTGNYKHAIASDDDIVIENGIINITSNGTDGIHVNNTFSMTGGTLNISALSDGIQAEEDIVIDSGTINVFKSEEGLESGTTLTINGGEINITSTDDGFNSGGSIGESSNANSRDMMKPEGERREPPQGMSGDMQSPPDNQNFPFNDSSSTDDMMRGSKEKPLPNHADISEDKTNTTNQTVDCSTYINGGVIKIKAEGDGIDSNADIYMTGGEVYVDGPQNGGDSAIDCNNFFISGGTILATGNSGMAMGASDTSEQCSFLVNLSENIMVGDVISVQDKNGNILVEYKANKQFNSILYSGTDLSLGETYSVFVNGEEKETVEMTSNSVSVGEHSNMGGMRPGRGIAGINNTQHQDIRVFIEGKEVMFDTSPIIQNDVTLVPLRTILETLGMTVNWDEIKIGG